MSKKLGAVMLDLDGTLVNTLSSLRDTMNKTMEHFGFDKISEEQTKKYVGNGYRNFVEKSMQATANRLYSEAERWEKKDPDKAFEFDQQADEVMLELDAACDYYLSIFEDNCTYKAEAYPGMKECLDSLRERGVKIACITNKSRDAAHKVLEYVYGRDYFDYISTDDGTHSLKPDTSVLQDACDRMNVELSECVFIGDTKTDMETARRAGIPSIGCVYGFRSREELREHGATICVDRAADILSALHTIAS